MVVRRYVCKACNAYVPQAPESERTPAVSYGLCRECFDQPRERDVETYSEAFWNMNKGRMSGLPTSEILELFYKYLGKVCMLRDKPKPPACKGTAQALDESRERQAMEKRLDQVRNAFTYHVPKGNQAARYQTLRDRGHTLAVMFDTHCPESPERRLAIEKLREAIMWANASIACNE